MKAEDEGRRGGRATAESESGMKEEGSARLEHWKGSSRRRREKERKNKLFPQKDERKSFRKEKEVSLMGTSDGHALSLL
jgi:hypothetical protein